MNYKHVILFIFLVGVITVGYLWHQAIQQQIRTQQKQIELLQLQLNQSQHDLDSLQQLQAKISHIISLIGSLDRTRQQYLCDNDTKQKIAKAIVKYGIPKHYSLYVALIAVESQGQPNVTNGACVGLFQINTFYHKPNGLMTIDGNIKVGCNMLNRTSGLNLCKVIAKFNGGYNPHYIAKVIRVKRIIDNSIIG